MVIKYISKSLGCIIIFNCLFKVVGLFCFKLFGIKNVLLMSVIKFSKDIIKKVVC